jgi:hypothetical protein
VRHWLVALLPASALFAVEACDKTPKADAPLAAVDDASTTAAEVDGARASATEAHDGGRRLVLNLAAASFVASVSDTPAWPEDDAGARRLGYLRNGAVVQAYDPPVKNDECKDGWYELVEGGYVCGKVATIDLTSPRVKLAPKQPDHDAGMPYRYGVNASDGTPLYRRVLSADDRRKFEHASSVKAHEGGESGTKEEAKDDEPSLVADEEPAPPPRRHGTKSTARERAEERERERERRERERNKDPFHGADAGRPLLKELKGHGVLVRRMARGFIVALDRDFRAAGTRWWRTTFGFAAPFDQIVPQGGATKYAGNWFTGESAVADLLPLPAGLDGGEPVPDLRAVSLDAGAPLAGAVAFATSGAGRKIELTDDGKGGFKVGWGTELPRRSAVLLTGRETTVSGVTYHQASGGFWVHLAELRMAKPQIPSDVGADERWVDVDLTRQQLVAFEGRRPVFATLVSSGRRNPGDAEHDFPTPTGTFRIREKHVTTTMDADVASDGPYSIEDVPWVMYFQGSYALHGAFWHDSFGNMRSHGCVNLSPEDARTLFHWAEPALPAGWHGVFAKDDSSGSRVVVHEDPPPKRR